MAVLAEGAQLTVAGKALLAAHHDFVAIALLLIFVALKLDRDAYVVVQLIAVLRLRRRVRAVVRDQLAVADQHGEHLADAVAQQVAQGLLLRRVLCMPTTRYVDAVPVTLD